MPKISDCFIVNHLVGHYLRDSLRGKSRISRIHLCSYAATRMHLTGYQWYLLETRNARGRLVGSTDTRSVCTIIQIRTHGWRRFYSLDCWASYITTFVEQHTDERFCLLPNILRTAMRKIFCAQLWRKSSWNEQYESTFLPPSTISCIQAPDIGTIAQMKRELKFRLLLRIFENI